MAHVGAFAGGVDEQGVPMNITFRQLVFRRSSIRLSSTYIHTDTHRVTQVYTPHLVLPCSQYQTDQYRPTVTHKANMKMV